MTEDEAYKVHIQYTSLDYLMNEKFVQFAEPEQIQEEIFRYYFLRQPQRVIGVHIGRTRRTVYPFSKVTNP